MMLKPEDVAQLERVLSSVEQLLPKVCKPVDWSTCSAANWRRHSFSGFLEPVKVTGSTASAKRPKAKLRGCAPCRRLTLFVRTK
jgi:predicted AAA+ superfamily ATPase